MDKIQRIKLASYSCSGLSLVATIYLINLVLQLTGLNILVAYLVSFVLGTFIQFIIYTMTSALFSMTLVQEGTKAKYWILAFAIICLLLDFAFSLGGLFVVTSGVFDSLILPIKILLFVLELLLALFITLGNELLELYSQLINISKVETNQKIVEEVRKPLTRNRY